MGGGSLASGFWASSERRGGRGASPPSRGVWLLHVLVRFRLNYGVTEFRGMGSNQGEDTTNNAGSKHDRYRKHQSRARRPAAGPRCACGHTECEANPSTIRHASQCSEGFVLVLCLFWSYFLWPFPSHSGHLSIFLYFESGLNQRDEAEPASVLVPPCQGEHQNRRRGRHATQTPLRCFPPLR